MMSPLMLTATLLAMQVPADRVTPDGAVPPGGINDDENAAGVIEGVVRAYEGTVVRPLPFVIVQVSLPGEQRATLADSLGRYRIEAVPPGTVRLRVSHIAHRSARLNVEVPDRGTISIDIDLEWSPIAMQPLRVLTDQISLPRVPARMDTTFPNVEVIALGASLGLERACSGIDGSNTSRPCSSTTAST